MAVRYGILHPYLAVLLGEVISQRLNFTCLFHRNARAQKRDPSSEEPENVNNADNPKNVAKSGHGKDSGVEEQNY